MIPANPTLARLREAAQGCRACPLWERATQTVFGEGLDHVPLMLVGEQPGDAEDRLGRPFVGPAGKLLDEALEEVGIRREDIYITNVVKHFKWEPRGKRRIHVQPSPAEIDACFPWLDAEITAVLPRAIVCLGATAAQALLGKNFRVTVSRGRFIESSRASLVMATVHPASLLRVPDEGARRHGIQRFTADLALVASALQG
jgi:uracil-DNA glycosylase family protein